MLTPGNTKLGRRRRLWGFGLPSRSTCPGRSALCAAACYSYRLEQFRPGVRARYRRNLALSRRSDFARRVLDLLAARQVEVVRVHTAGDFYSAAYARQWLAVMRAAPAVRFFLYTRSWRQRDLRRVLGAMARLPNVRVWFSCDRETGLPRRVPARVRLAWLMTGPDDRPPRADLVFRVRRLRGAVQKRVAWRDGPGAALVCPTENGVTGHRTSCSQCSFCWRALPEPPGEWRLSLPLLPPHRQAPRARPPPPHARGRLGMSARHPAALRRRVPDSGATPRGTSRSRPRRVERFGTQPNGARRTSGAPVGGD
jgi:hypothetical protein